ncbi:hypothetical protein GCM10010168_92700 [Actinoplanes ianthinogenes]|uniref:Uncharacterized protein n=1 Tax=Actinoplanes ianthinogenes TaxID=122358 RepID=A0ABM7LJW1_9ACTN|nr:hypothetical protein [Actinoplanes ianthinogenes]BCJ39551.1 hypothetical protein Aiant_02080 [Actinoplanes ianthinogenes]GGR59188.1 hypothetical protein GCM10010168_92700 [Actinoplanes ianthinogenes]
MNHWSNHQLTEFFATVCAPQDEQSAVTVAVERVAEVLETEVGAVLRNGRVQVAWGASRNRACCPEMIGPPRSACPGSPRCT